MMSLLWLLPLSIVTAVYLLVSDDTEELENKISSKLSDKWDKL